MKGRIKFFSENEGYGFIHGEDGIEYYFDIHRIKSFTSVPKMGNSVTFDVSPNKKEQTEEKKGRGRPASNIKKRKVTFDLSEDLITELDKVALFYGMNRAQFVSQAVMKAVREAQRTENL